MIIVAIRTIPLLLASVIVYFQFLVSDIRFTARKIEDARINSLLKELYKNEVPRFITIETLIENINAKDTLCLIFNRERINNPQFTIITNGENIVHHINRGRRQNPFPQFDTIYIPPRGRFLDTLTFAIVDLIPEKETVFARFEFDRCDCVIDSVTTIVNR